MNRVVKTATAVLSVAALVAMAGCGAEEKLGKTNDEVKKTTADYLHASYEDLKDGGTLTLPIETVPEQMNVFQATATLDTMNMWYWYNPVISLFDDEGVWQANPDYVTKVEDKVVDGKTVVTYDLNEKAKFNDGTPFDWKVWEGTWKAGSGEDKAYQLGDTSGYAAVEKVERGANDFQAVVTYKKTFPWWKKNFGFVMHPALAASGEAFNTTYVNNPHPEWGAGPFKATEYDSKAGKFIFEPNEKWWGKPTKLEKVVVRALEGNADLNAFRNKEIDLVAVGNKNRLSQVKDDNVPIYTGQSLGETALTLNSKRPLLGDIKVRKALMLAVDRQTIMDVRFQGMNYKGDLLGSLILKPTQPGYEDNLGDLGKFDAEAAKKLLDEAGWKLQEGKEFRTNDKGEELELMMPSFGTTETLTAIYNTLMALWKNVGVKLNIEQKKPADYPQIMANAEFDVMMNGYYADNPFAMGDICQFYEQGQNLTKSGLGSEEIDKLCNESITAKDEAEALKLGNETEKKALEMAGMMPVMSGPAMVATKPGLANRGAMGFARLAPELIGWTDAPAASPEGK
ncbi:hypothetical protein BK816_00175 [Boudabousia tangfeifanii]|uniref:Solute-binding protein family 5 domain-containing protein n=1 Tax=Boudabousia tangfeifanii TaxID=1912795 RepID=A0A1D9MI72_9ACTO|nr:ABC transporter family substrate-binding protein [Boudabousia tangfeifanii]AOZ71898.1 hypothetical protein BK816_00175 [Boudabousia tangfeifanii]